MIDIRRIIGGNLMANGYIVSSPGGKCFIIDPGYNAREYVTYINERELKPEGIILTHDHYDHTGVSDQLSKELECMVYMHRKDADGYRGRVDVFLDGGEHLAIDDEICEVIHTPGHTRGGICLMFEDDKACFTGDTIFNVDLGRTDLDGGSEQEMIRSITEVIDKWPNDIRIYPGHGDDCTMKTVRKINIEFLDIVDKGRR